MEGLRNTPGFLGTNAGLLADLNLVIQIILFMVLCVGVMAQRKQKYHWHDKLQTPVIVLNFFFILLIMWPSFRGISGEIPANLSQTFVLVPTLHAVFGLIAEGLAIYCLLAGWRILPRKIGVLRYWMWACFIFWTASIMFGVGTYIVWYTSSPVAVEAPAVDNLVGEHDEELLEAPGDTVTATPAEAETETQPEDNVVSEHDEEPVEAPAEAPTDTPAPSPAEATATPEAATEDDGLVGEHDEEPLEALATDTPLPEPTEAPTEAAADTPVPAEATATSEPVSEPDEAVGEHDEEAVLEPAEPAPVVEGESALVWQAITPTNTGPGERYQHAMIYNPTDNKIYLFGGQGQGQTYNDVWVFDLESLSWQEVGADSPEKPPARHTTVLSFDRAGENLYVATGQNSSGVLNDVWELNLATETWQNVGEGSTSVPTARYGSGGGSLNGDLVLTHGFGSTRYDDSWAFDIDTGEWENITPVGDLPLKRCLFAAATAPNTVVLHGGCASGFGDCYLEDTWVLNTSGGGWREIITAEKPAGRQHQTLVRVEDGPEYMLYGGQDASRAALADVWLLNVETDAWQALAGTSDLPPRYNHQAVWVPNLGMMVYGGRNADGPLADLWLLNWSQ